MISLRNKFLLLVLFLSFSSMAVFAQLKKEPVWKMVSSKPTAKIGDEVEIVLTSVIEKDWYMYSNDMDPNLGPIAAEFTWKKDPSYTLVGKTKPVGSHKHYEEVWKGTVSVMKGTAKFIQKIKLLSAKPKVKVGIYFQECSEVTGMCMPPYEQEYELKGLQVTASAETPTSPETTPEVIEASTETKPAELGKAESAVKQQDTNSIVLLETKAITAVAAPAKAEESFFSFLIIAFLGGLIAVVTPCVFPMLPMTVSFFTKKSETRSQGITRAFTFGLSIVGIYASLGLIFAFFGLGPDFGNWLSTHWIPNVLFFVIFLVFAASFLGMFEITLPHQFVNKVDSKSSMGNFMGIFFMAFTLALVSFSCTGPVVGSLLIEAVGGKFLKPLLGMASFGFGLALPFTLFAVFPSWLQNLPKSGGWLNSVKVVLGFVEIAFAFKFLSTADVVYHWGILDREIYLTIWIVIAILLGMYLLGKIKFSHDSDMPYIGVPRFGLAVLSFCFAVYMIPGLFGAPLKALSGLLPPMSTQDFILGGKESHSSNAGQTETKKVVTKHSDFLELPHGLTGYFDYKEALAASKATGKPIFVDFTGHACVNCRKMEEYVWAKPEVLKRLQNDFIIVSLYADERKELPENEWYTSTRDNKVKKTIGEQNQDLQISKYNFSAQPQYVVIDGNEKQLSGPRFYDTDEAAFVKFLDDGKAAFGK